MSLPEPSSSVLTAQNTEPSGPKESNKTGKKSILPIVIIRLRGFLSGLRTCRFKRFLGWVAVAFLIYVLDVWFVGSAACLIAATQKWWQSGMTGSPDFHWAQTVFRYPLSASWGMLSGAGFPAAVRSAWLCANALVVPLVALVFLAGRSWLRDKNVLRLSRDPSRGSASWMESSRVAKVLGVGPGPGLILGTEVGSGRIVRLPSPELTRYNSHVAVFGASGSMKSRALIRNAILQAPETGASIVATDSKGELYRDCAAFLEQAGYTVRVFNLVSMLNSDRWNVLNEIKSDIDAQVFTEVVIANTALPGVQKRGGDPFWDRGEQNLLKALALYCVNDLPEERRNMGSLYSILSSGSARKLDDIFSGLSLSHPARMSYNIFLMAEEKIRGGIVTGLGTRLQIFQNETVRRFTAQSDIDLSLPGKEKCAYFCVIPDTHSALDFLASLFFSFLFIRLTEYADRSGGPCPVPIYFLLDEFCNIGAIPDFTRKISTIRSRNLHCSVVFQNIAQLENRYPNNAWQEIIGNCDAKLFLGGNDPDTARFVVSLLGQATVETVSFTKDAGPEGWFDWGKVSTRPESRKLMTEDEVLRLPLDEAILMLRGEKPLRLKKLDYTRHPNARLLTPRPVEDYLPEWAQEVLSGFQVARNEASFPPAATAGEPADAVALNNVLLDGGGEKGESSMEGNATPAGKNAKRKPGDAPFWGI